MNSNTILFAVTRNVSAKGKPEESNPNNILSLHRRLEDAVKECDFQLKYALTERYPAEQFNGREKNTFHSTTNHYVNEEGNYNEEKEMPGVEGLGCCDWVIYYTNRMQSTVNDYHEGFSVVKWIDFEY